MGQHFFFHFSSAMVVDDNVKTKWDKGIFYTRVMKKKKKSSLSRDGNLIKIKSLRDV